MTANTALLNPRSDANWRLGLTNMLKKENFAWWRTRRWWMQILIAVLILNGTTALNMKGGGNNSIGNAAMNTLMTAALFVPIIAAVLMQDAILGERHSGTTAWVFSKPLHRPAFILAKLLAYGLGFLVTWVIIPLAILYFQITSKGFGGLSVPGYIGMIGLAFLNLLFYMTLALMLATIFNSRGPVLGITIFIAWIGPMGFLFAPMQKSVPWVMDIMPWKLIALVGPYPPIGGLLALGDPLPTVLPIIATAVWCLVFVAVAIWRISREEF